MLGLLFLPRSPRWLAKFGRTEQAIKTLADIQAKSNIDNPFVIAEWEEIWTIFSAELESPSGWRKVFHHGMWKRTLAGMSVQAWQQLSGANVMTYSVVYVFRMAGLTRNINLISPGVQYAFFVLNPIPFHLLSSHLISSTLHLYLHLHLHLRPPPLEQKAQHRTTYVGSSNT